MVITLLFKNTLIKIRKSLGRFISLFMIILVGVGFFAGIRESIPDIITSLSRYMNSQDLMDFKIVSTMGLTEDDVIALKSLKGVSTVTPSHSLDVLSQGKAIRVHAIEKSVNTFRLAAGHMPQKNTECVADSRYYKLGDKITITGDVGKNLKCTAFTVVGTAESSLYMSKEYGNSTVGNGSLYSYIFINKNCFTLDAYTEIYMIAAKANNVPAFSEEYDSITSQLNDELVKLKPAREETRHREIYDKADTAVQNSEKKLNDEKSKGEEKLAAAKAKLDASALKLRDAKNELIQNESDLQKQITIQNAKFKTAKEQIANGWNQINTALRSIKITKDQLDGKIKELKTTIQSMKKQLSMLPADSLEYEQLAAGIQQYSASEQELLKLQASIKELNNREKQLNQGIAAFNLQIADAENKIAEGKNKLTKNQKKLDDGYAQYNENESDFKVKITDAQSKLQDAKGKLSELSEPKWTILDRDIVINGYNDLKSAMNTIKLIVAILPLFFILIVALMTSNTMTRMITEERTELGILTSLGFGDRSIIFTYLFYVLTATILGTGSGFLLGCAIIPKIIYSCFPYILPPLINRYDMITFLLILAFAIALMTLVTVIFCNHELKEKPASLIRPVPPQNGKTILLEKVGFIWKRLSFTWKVTMRNIFRYKERAFMTIIGIAGCTALLLAGFGIKDSINGVAQKQYQEILKYHNLMVLKDPIQKMNGDLNALLAKEHIQNPVLIRQTALTCESKKKTLDAYLIVPENEETFYRYYNLRSTRTGSNLTLNDNGVIISHKIAEAYSLGKGSKILVKDADGKEYQLNVSDITENYIQNYIYMSKNLYSKVFGKTVSYNMAVSDFTGDENTLAKDLISSGLIVNIIFKSDILEQVNAQNSSLQSVVLLLIGIASLLAIIVLYNLTSINISERKREIATLKVLGFKDGETNEYVYREVFLLTLISIGVGLALGTGLHHYVMNIIERDEVVYFKSIKGLSFLYTVLITIAFSAIMQIVTYFNLKKIDMIESLKSVE